MRLPDELKPIHPPLPPRSPTGKRLGTPILAASLRRRRPINPLSDPALELGLEAHRRARRRIFRWLGFLVCALLALLWFHTVVG